MAFCIFVQRLGMVTYYNSGYITHRGRKIGIIWSGETAQHLMEERLKSPRSHPLTNIGVQQIAAKISNWKNEKGKRYSGSYNDHKSGHRIRVIIDIYTKFSIIVSGFKF